jgi:hypothetical protein
MDSAPSTSKLRVGRAAKLLQKEFNNDDNDDDE